MRRQASHRRRQDLRKEPADTASAVAVPGLRETQVASMTAGLVTRITLHPFDTCKTRLQHIRGAHPTRVMWEFIRVERLSGLYRGIVGALAGVLPYSLFYMPSYEWGQRKLDTLIGQRQLWGARNIAAGAFAGLCGSVIKTPVDVVKKRVQAGLYRNALAAMLALSQEAKGAGLMRGMSPFYCGWRSSVLYDIPYNAVQFSILEMVKRIQRWHTERFPSRNNGRAKSGSRSIISGTRENILTGAITGALTSLVTEPLDVVKTRIMTQQRASIVQPGATYYKDCFHGLRTIVREEGVQALWKGSIPRLLWVAGSGAVWYGTYATVRQHMVQRRNIIALQKEKHARHSHNIAFSHSPQHGK